MINEEQISGIKWNILVELSKESLSPKELAQKLNTTIANVSQNLKLLEAYNYIKKKKNNQGKDSRKYEDKRIIYSLAKTSAFIINIQPNNTKKNEVKINTLNQLMINLMLIEQKENLEPILLFYINHKNLIDLTDATYFLEQKNDETHLLVITEKTELFRIEKSRIELNINNKKHTIIFWSHTIIEFIEGIKRKEQYFINQWKKAKILLENKNGITKKIEEEQKEK